MTINGLPAHALIVHAAVVFGPISSLMALGYVAVPRWRHYLRWPMVVVAVMAGLAVTAAFVTGGSYLHDTPALHQLPEVETHAQRAHVLIWVMSAYSIVAIAVGVRFERSGALRLAGDGLLAVLAVASLVLVVMTGDAGAHAVWGAG